MADSIRGARQSTQPPKLWPEVGSHWRHIGDDAIPGTGLLIEVVAVDSFYFYARYPDAEGRGAKARRYVLPWNTRGLWVEVAND